MSGQGPRDRRNILEQAYGIDHPPAGLPRPKRLEPRQYRPIPPPEIKKTGKTPSAKLPTPQASSLTPQASPAPPPFLSLVGTGPDNHKPAAPKEQPVLTATDPRWVLAVRTSEKLQGTILPPEARQRLMKLGHVLGLSPFDTSLVIAIVQDQARRGLRPSQCPAAGEPQLRMIPLPHTTIFLAAIKRLTGWQIAMIFVALIATELVVLNWMF